MGWREWDAGSWHDVSGMMVDCTGMLRGFCMVNVRLALTKLMG